MSEKVLVKMQSGRCQLCEAPDRPGYLTIQDSVGRGGRNRPDDVRTIQSALDAQDVAAGGPSVKLDVDGLSGPLTIATIEKYQRRQLGWADGRVDPDGPTVRKLNGSGGVAVPTQKAGANPPPAPPPTPEQNKVFIEQVGGLLPRARHWVETAYSSSIWRATTSAEARPIRRIPSPRSTILVSPSLLCLTNISTAISNPEP